MIADRQVIDEGLADPRLERVRDELADLVLESIRLVPDAGGETRSHIGGRPHLPEGVDWPEWSGRPLGFVAEIDLSELPPGFVLAGEGSLAFFYDVDGGRQPWGFDPADRGAAAVVATPRFGAGAPRAVPAGVEMQYAPRPLRFATELTVPDTESAAVEPLELTDDEQDAWFEVGRALVEAHTSAGEAMHRLLGHPDQIQGDMQLQVQLTTNGLFTGDSTGYHDPRAETLARGAERWRLLAQFDSELEPRELLWGDLGRVYFWLRDDDLAAGRFDATWGILQCG